MTQIVGKIDDDEYIHSEESEVVPISYDRFMIDGSLPVGDVVDLIGFEPEETEECETAAGLLLNLFDRIPNAGNKVTIEHRETKVTFTVIHMEKHRIDKIGVKIEKKPKPAEEEDD